MVTSSLSSKSSSEHDETVLTEFVEVSQVKAKSHVIHASQALAEQPLYPTN